MALAVILIMAVVALMDLLLIIGAAKLEGEGSLQRLARTRQRFWRVDKQTDGYSAMRYLQA